MKRTLALPSLLVLAVAAAVARSPLPPAAAGSDPVAAAAGDIACDPVERPRGACGMGATSDLLVHANLTAVLTLGDNQYEDGAYWKFLRSYGPTWGRVKEITRPSPGNHDYLTPGAAGYFRYFGRAAGAPSRGYYSYEVGRWHLVALNSNCAEVGGCGVGSPQERWLRADLAAHRTACTLAYWHHPRFSSGLHGSSASMQPIWRALYDARADVVLSAHDHDYERFAPQDPAGRYDAAHGIREFVVGTGGQSHYSFATVRANSEVRDSTTFGVLELVLHANRYDWRFVPDAGRSFTDRGSAACR